MIWAPGIERSMRSQGDEGLPVALGLSPPYGCEWKPWNRKAMGSFTLISDTLNQASDLRAHVLDGQGRVAVLALHESTCRHWKVGTAHWTLQLNRTKTPLPLWRRLARLPGLRLLQYLSSDFGYLVVYLLLEPADFICVRLYFFVFSHPRREGEKGATLDSTALAVENLRDYEKVALDDCEISDGLSRPRGQLPLVQGVAYVGLELPEYLLLRCPGEHLDLHELHHLLIKRLDFVRRTRQVHFGLEALHTYYPLLVNNPVFAVFHPL
jgi:hypothetical protein